MPISPTNGRIVWFTPSAESSLPGYGDKPWAAMVCHVWGDHMVNLLVVQPDGIIRSETSVLLLQDDSVPPAGTDRFAQWMPYQIGQAKKHAEPS